MANDNGMADKNLSNVVEDLAEAPVNAHHAQQLQQKHNDRRHQDALNHDEPVKSRASLDHHE
ncbi:hypothetical protein [Cohnella nanjingensis]|uniref:Uncharacterized protein n=1 Tax=Cohnella nanjingensis TaxID=1387779 RepID=A0A7X0RPK6_9BACL|nr:hypothetical protein [Cohnella nanjingensis]MBB6670186.1 hypothetical protein [Cohnella nanjingensis]